tara:strand:- start:4698 stop:6335 length:1638 start_codon:yes stop_codon:yes gene_type:complete
MESIIKLQSEQGFVETAVPLNFKNSKLVDFIIPGNNGVTYDLGKSYININMEVVPHNPTAIIGEVATPVIAAGATTEPFYQNDIVFESETAVGRKPLADCATMVRNASMFSQNRGMVESIRRVNVLRSILWNIENNKGNQHDGLQKFGTFQGRRGIKNETSSLLQVIGINTQPNALSTADDTKKAQLLSRDFRIPLSDLFGVGSAVWNGDVYGDTRIHLELEPNRLVIQQCGGSEDTSALTLPSGDVFYGAMDSADGGDFPLLPATKSLGTDQPLRTTIPYQNPELQCPFYVGAAIKVEFTKAITGGATTTGNVKYAVIASIKYNSGDNSTNPPTTPNQKIEITTTSPIHTAGAATEGITAILVNTMLSKAGDDQIRINGAELVLSEMVGVEGPTSIDYRTYSTEETQNGSGVASFNKQIVCEPNAQNLIIANCVSGQILPDRAWNNYRLAINNRDVAGNRDIGWNSPLYKDRALRFLKNRDQTPQNMSFNAILSGQEQGASANQANIYPILETLPLTTESKIVNLELDGTPQDVIFFKELAKTI